MNWKKLMADVFLRISVWAFNKLYNFIDKDNDGLLSQDELFEFGEFVTEKIEAIKNK